MIKLPLLAQVRFEGAYSGFVTDHNRRATELQNEMINNQKRMANGQMRERYVATKRKYDFRFESFPSKTSYTVDGNWGGEDIMAFYYYHRSFTLKLYHSALATNQAAPFFSGTFMWEDAPSYTIVGRQPNFDLWDMSFSLVEV